MFFAYTDLKRLRWPLRLLVNALQFLGFIILVLLFIFFQWSAGRLSFPDTSYPHSIHGKSSGLLALVGLLHQSHGLLRVVLCLIQFIASLSVSHLAVFGSLAVAMRWRAGWSSTQAYRFVFSSEVPPSWRKPPPHAY